MAMTLFCPSALSSRRSSTPRLSCFDRHGKEFFELAYGLRQKRPNEEPGLIYSRINNPDLEMLEDRLAIWDQAEASLVFASGMAQPRSGPMRAPAR